MSHPATNRSKGLVSCKGAPTQRPAKCGKGDYSHSKMESAYNSLQGRTPHLRQRPAERKKKENFRAARTDWCPSSTPPAPAQDQFALALPPDHIQTVFTAAVPFSTPAEGTPSKLRRTTRSYLRSSEPTVPIDSSPFVVPTARASTSAAPKAARRDSSSPPTLNLRVRNSHATLKEIGRAHV